MPNELETAILHAIALQQPQLTPCLAGLRVLNREYTGIGTFTNFAQSPAAVCMPDCLVELNGTVEVLGLAHGLSASLTIQTGHIQYLEIVSFAGESWSGAHAEFTIRRA
jgi:hypothetical protein